MRRKLAAILTADVVDFSRRMSEDEVGTLAAVRGLIEREIQPAVAERNGTVFKTMGDGVLAIFDSAVEAVDCAAALRRRAFEAGLGLRQAVHMGDVIAEGGDYFGDGINVAKRLEGLGQPGEIVVSGDVFRAVRRKLALDFQARGPQRLKNIPDEVEVYVVPAGETVPSAATAAVTVAPRRAGPAAGVTDRASIIVLPFTNLSHDPEQEYFCDGLTQDITTDLSKFANLFVFAANSAFTYKGRAVRPSALAEELGVRYLLEGSVQRGGRKVRINAQLIEAESEQHLWADRVDSALEDILDAQDDMVRRIVSVLAVKMTASEMERANRKRSTDASAYDAFLRGAHTYAAQVDSTAESEAGLLEAIGWFERATEIDPGYARAWGWLAYCHMNRVIEGWAGPELLPRIEAWARRAVALSPNDYDTHWALGFVYSASGRPELGHAAFQQALMLNPNDANMLVEMAETMTALGRHEEAVAQIERAMQLNPHFPEWYRWALGWALHHARHYERSIQQLQLIMAPNNEVRLIMAANCARLAEAAKRGGDSSCHAELAAAALRWCDEFRRRRGDWTLGKERESTHFTRRADLEHWLEGLGLAGLA